jgi:hypothetical protein
MGLFKKLIKTGLNVITAPVDIVKDVATLGGLVTDQNELYTIQKAKKILKNTEEIQGEIDDL